MRLGSYAVNELLICWFIVAIKTNGEISNEQKEIKMGPVLISGSRDRTIKFFDINAGLCLFTLVIFNFILKLFEKWSKKVGIFSVITTNFYETFCHFVYYRFSVCIILQLFTLNFYRLDMITGYVVCVFIQAVSFLFRWVMTKQWGSGRSVRSDVARL